MKAIARVAAFLPSGEVVLTPVTVDEQEKLRKFKLGDWVLCDHKSSRSLKQSALFWSLVGLLAENMDEPLLRNKDNMADAIKLRLGFCDTFMGLDGEIIKRPKSLAFGKTGQAEFNDFFRAFVEYIETEILPGINRADLDREWKKRLASDHPAWITDIPHLGKIR